MWESPFDLLKRWTGSRRIAQPWPEIQKQESFAVRCRQSWL